MKIDLTEFAGTYSIEEASMMAVKLQEKIEKYKSENAGSEVTTDASKTLTNERMIYAIESGIIKELIDKGCIVREHAKQGKFVINTFDFTLDFYPKSNKILIHGGEWKTDALNWLNIHILHK
jgi:hypothetical protein